MEGDGAEAQLLADAILFEIHFNCRRLLGHWKGLLSLLTAGDPGTLQGRAVLNVKVWDRLDSILSHAARVDRLLNPTEGRAPESFPARAKISKDLLAKVPSGRFEARTVREARNVFEHSDEYLPHFLANLNGRTPTQFTLGPDPRITPRPDGKVAFRTYDPFTCELIVFDQSVNLASVARSVRELLMYLPEPKMAASVTPVPIPEPE